MIHVARDRLDGHGRPVCPSEAWFTRAAAATERALRDGPSHDVSAGIYADDEVRSALQTLFHRKCAYCESPMAAVTTAHIDHFRPHGRVAERPEHTGYYWLAYAWLNLYPSCERCNCRRRERSDWDDPPNGDEAAAGKADQFPLRDESRRAMLPKDALDKEEPLLLDPCRDDPESHLVFDVAGDVAPRPDDARAAKTVEVMFLRRKALRAARRTVATRVVRLLKIATAKPECRGEVDAYLAEYQVADNCEYAAVARAVLRDTAAFGLRVQ